MRMELIQADITTLAIDAIVNAANNAMCGGGGVDGAIHRAAGPDLLALCRTLGGCATGGAKITPGFNLPAQHIIHTVGPVWSGGHKGEAELLRSCYRACMDLVFEHGLNSIAFPSISCGSYRFPVAQAAQIAISTIKESLSRNSSIQVYLVNYDEKTHTKYRKVFDAEHE